MSEAWPRRDERQSGTHIAFDNRTETGTPVVGGRFDAGVVAAGRHQIDSDVTDMASVRHPGRSMHRLGHNEGDAHGFVVEDGLVFHTMARKDVGSSIHKRLSFSKMDNQ